MRPIGSFDCGCPGTQEFHAITNLGRAALRVAAALFSCSITLGQTTFDGKWVTKLTCPPKGNTAGYTGQFDSSIQNSKLRRERGTAGEPGYLLIEGKIAADGRACTFDFVKQ